MKKFIFAILLVAGLGVFIPEANADNHAWYGNYNRYYGRNSSRYDDRYHHNNHYYSDRSHQSHYRGDRYYSSRPRVVYYRHRPVRVYEDYGYYTPRVRYYESRPRISFSFGF